MNKLEEKCSLLAKTPQVRWFDLRFKPMILLLSNMASEGTITLRQMNVPVFQMMGIVIHVFNYDGEFYFLFINQNGNVTECFHLERTNSSLGSIISSHLVLSSDDAPEDTWMPLLAVSIGAKNNKEFISKIKSML